jgi:hypothetical protein
MTFPAAIIIFNITSLQRKMQELRHSKRLRNRIEDSL